MPKPKTVPLIRTIKDVVLAFAAGEIPPAGEIIRTRNRLLHTDGRHLTYRHVAEGSIIVAIRASKAPVIVLNDKWHSYYGRITHTLRESKAQVIHVFMSWGSFTDPEELCPEIYKALERQAILTKEKTRDQVIAQWCSVCTSLGFGAYIGAPPHTGN